MNTIYTYDNKNDILLDDALNIIKQSIVSNGFADIIELKLFGSYARGDATEGSDIDVFLVYNNIEKEIADNKIADIMTALNIKLKCMVSITAIPFNQLNTGTLFYKHIQKDGKNI